MVDDVDPVMAFFARTHVRLPKAFDHRPAYAAGSPESPRVVPKYMTAFGRWRRA